MKAFGYFFAILLASTLGVLAAKPELAKEIKLPTFATPETEVRAAYEGARLDMADAHDEAHDRWLSGEIISPAEDLAFMGEVKKRIQARNFSKLGQEFNADFSDGKTIDKNRAAAAHAAAAVEFRR